MLVGARDDEASQPLLGQLLAQQHEPFGARHAFEVFRLYAVAMIDRQRRLERLQLGRKLRRCRLGDQGVPARPDLRRRREHTGDQRLDRGDIERGARPLERYRQPISIWSRPTHFCSRHRHRQSSAYSSRYGPAATSALSILQRRSLSINQSAILTYAWLLCVWIVDKY